MLSTRCAVQAGQSRAHRTLDTIAPPLRFPAPASLPLHRRESCSILLPRIYSARTHRGWHCAVCHVKLCIVRRTVLPGVNGSRTHPTAWTTVLTSVHASHRCAPRYTSMLGFATADSELATQLRRVSRRACCVPSGPTHPSSIAHTRSSHAVNVATKANTEGTSVASAVAISGWAQTLATKLASTRAAMYVCPNRYFGLDSSLTRVDHHSNTSTFKSEVHVRFVRLDLWLVARL
jgi:hypothetical protein